MVEAEKYFYHQNTSYIQWHAKVSHFFDGKPPFFLQKHMWIICLEIGHSHPNRRVNQKKVQISNG